MAIGKERLAEMRVELAQLYDTEIAHELLAEVERLQAVLQNQYDNGVCDDEDARWSAGYALGYCD